MGLASSTTKRYFEVDGPKRLCSREKPWTPDTIGCHAAAALFYGSCEPVTYQIRRVRANGTYMQRRQPVITITTSYAGFCAYVSTKAKRPYDLSTAEWLAVEQIGECAEKHFQFLCETYPHKAPAGKVA